MLLTGIDAREHQLKERGRSFTLRHQNEAQADAMRAEDQKNAGCEAVVPKLRFAALRGCVLAAVSCPGWHSAQDWESRHVHVVRLSAPWCRVMWDLHAHPTFTLCSKWLGKSGSWTRWASQRSIAVRPALPRTSGHSFTISAWTQR